MRPPPGEAMLPWKRHKLELSGGKEEAEAEEEKRGPSGPSPSSSSVAVPGALVRVGRLLGWRRRRRSFSVSGRESPSSSSSASSPSGLRALYLGQAATAQAKGEGCAEAALGRIWLRSRAGREGARVRLWLGPQGLRLAPEDHEETEPPVLQPQLFLLSRVTHCAAEARLPRLLSWVYRHEGRHKAVVLRCHAALLPKAAQAQALALRLRQSADQALRDFRRLKKRSDARRQRRLLLLRHRRPDDDDDGALLPDGGGGIGDPGPRKDPRGRATGAPRLRAIAEDPAGEEREAREDPDREDREEEEEEGRLVRGLGRMGLGGNQHNHHGPRPETPREPRTPTEPR